jgi:hypothetical protein
MADRITHRPAAANVARIAWFIKTQAQQKKPSRLEDEIVSR